MNKYESVIIINPNLDESAVKNTVDFVTGLINKSGKVEKVDEIGKKKLAYEVKKNSEGYYVVFTFDAEPDSITELERNYRIKDEIIKFIVIRKDEE